MKLTSLTSCRRADCLGSRDSSLRAAVAPANPPPAITTLEATTQVCRADDASERLLQASLGTQTRADQLLHCAAVGSALSLLPDRAHDAPDRLGVALSDLLGGLRLRLDRSVDDRLELARVRDLRESLAFDHRLRVAALGHEPGKHLLARPVRD